MNRVFVLFDNNNILHDISTCTDRLLLLLIVVNSELLSVVYNVFLVADVWDPSQFAFKKSLTHAVFWRLLSFTFILLAHFVKVFFLIII